MPLKFVDICNGMGGFRTAMQRVYPDSQCVFSSDIKKTAIKVYKDNFGEDCHNDITRINPQNVPDFDILCAGFPCQAFSSAGKRRGFLDTRGTVFFYILQIIKEKKPPHIIMENVEGLLTHKKGQTFQIIKGCLENEGYYVYHRVISGVDVGVPQDRRRVYIVCTQDKPFEFEEPVVLNEIKLSNVLQQGVTNRYVHDNVTKKLLASFSGEELNGKKVNDKRGGDGNIHSWDMGLKGEVQGSARELMNKFLTQRRRKSWAKINNVKWSDGMPLSVENIRTFHDVDNLRELLSDLVNKGYMKEVHNGWYDMYGGKLSFSVAHILHPNEPTPTIVATDANKLVVVDNGKLRRLTLVEFLRLFGYDDDYDFSSVTYNQALDLLGNSIVVPIVEEILHLLNFGKKHTSFPTLQ